MWQPWGEVVCLEGTFGITWILRIERGQPSRCWSAVTKAM
jgi:hypothetical protein